MGQRGESMIRYIGIYGELFDLVDIRVRLYNGENEQLILTSDRL